MHRFRLNAPFPGLNAAVPALKVAFPVDRNIEALASLTPAGSRTVATGGAVAEPVGVVSFLIYLAHGAKEIQCTRVLATAASNRLLKKRPERDAIAAVTTKTPGMETGRYKEIKGAKRRE